MNDEYGRPSYQTRNSTAFQQKPLGKSFAVGNNLESGQKFSLSQSDRENHTHIIGSTGTGKSKFLELLLRQDIKNRRAGLCLIDPHGSLYDEIILHASHRYSSYADRFILFNPAGENEDIIGFNPVHPEAESLDYLLESLISACLKAWGQDDTDRTPRITKWLGNIFHTLISNDLTLIESVPLLSIHNKDQRELLLRNVHNDLVLDDWRMFEVSSNTQKQSLIEGAANRLRKFLNSESIRNIVGQRDRVLDFSKAMDEGKIILINLNGQGKISQENMKLLGILVVNEIFRCAKLRDTRDRNLKPFYFYIDEFAQFVTRDIARSLEEARKFKLFMILAHQHLAQLQKDDEYLYASVLTNCRNKVVFGGLSREDAKIMTDEVSTGFVNLQSIKDEIYTTKARQNLEKRTVGSWTEGTSESQSKGSSVGHTDGVSEGHSEGISEGKSFGLSLGKSKGKTKGHSDTATEGNAQTNSRSEGRNYSRSFAQSVGFQPIKDAGEAVAKKLFGKGNDPSSWGQTQGETEGQTFQTGQSDTQSQSKSHSENASETSTNTETQSKTNTKSHSRSEIRSTSKSDSRSTSDTHSTGTSKSKGISETWVNSAEEYQELSSRTFWSLQELEYMQMADLKNQGVAQAFFKLKESAPMSVQIERIDSVFYHNRTSEQRLKRFKTKAVTSNQSCYTPIDQVYLEREQRQIAAFGEPLQLDSHTIEGKFVEVQNGAVKPHDDPFN